MAADRIQEIIDAAERLAGDIHAEAANEARQYLADRRLEADEIAEAQAQQLEQVLEALRGHARAMEETATEMVRAVESAIAESRREPLRDVPTGPTLRPSPAEDGVRTENGPATAVEPGSNSEEAQAQETGSDPRRNLRQQVSQVSVANDPARSTEDRESAVIRATQLAISGSERGEIEATLRNDFGVDDPESIVDEILGPA